MLKTPLLPLFHAKNAKNGTEKQTMPMKNIAKIVLPPPGFSPNEGGWGGGPPPIRAVTPHPASSKWLKSHKVYV